VRECVPGKETERVCHVVAITEQSVCSRERERKSVRRVGVAFIVCEIESGRECVPGRESERVFVT